MEQQSNKNRFMLVLLGVIMGLYPVRWAAIGMAFFIGLVLGLLVGGLIHIPCTLH